MVPAVATSAGYLRVARPNRVHVPKVHIASVFHSLAILYLFTQVCTGDYFRMKTWTLREASLGYFNGTQYKKLKFSAKKKNRKKIGFHRIQFEA